MNHLLVLTLRKLKGSKLLTNQFTIPGCYNKKASTGNQSLVVLIIFRTFIEATPVFVDKQLTSTGALL